MQKKEKDMVKVSVQKDGLAVTGHAGYAPVGHDIVCAGVTALVISLEASLKSLTEDKIESSISPGRVEIHYKNPSEAAKFLIDSFFLGICKIAREYPEYVGIA